MRGDEKFVDEEAVCVDGKKAGDEDVDASCKCGQEKGGCTRNPL